MSVDDLLKQQVTAYPRSLNRYWQAATVVMNPLQAVVDLLVDVDSWPIYVIYNIFVDVPYPSSVKKVAAFIYGNGFPIDIGVKCFNAFNGELSSFVSHAMDTWYAIWDKNLYTKLKAEYYSMFF